MQRLSQQSEIFTCTTQNNFDFSEYYKLALPGHNQPSPVLNNHLAWIVGFFEGDGSLSHRRGTRLKNSRVKGEPPILVPAAPRCDFQIIQKDSEVLYFVQKTLGF